MPRMLIASLTVLAALAVMAADRLMGPVAPTWMVFAGQGVGLVGRCRAIRRLAASIYRPFQPNAGNGMEYARWETES